MIKKNKMKILELENAKRDSKNVLSGRLKTAGESVSEFENRPNRNESN